MKKQLLIAAGAAGLLACVQPASANLMVPTPGNPLIGTGTLGPSGGAPAGDDLSVQYTVTSSGGAMPVYTYSYNIVNPGTDTDYVDTFALAFNTTAPGAYIANSANGGQLVPSVYPDVESDGITWSIKKILPGQSVVGVFGAPLTFESYDPPVLGNVTANDTTTPPAPWTSINPGGSPVPIPAVPDGGMTVALLGGALLVLSGVSRKLNK